MQGIKHRSSKLFYQFCLEEAIPADHPYRRIERALDLRFLYKRTRDYYGSDGQKSIDPVVFFKLCLLGYLNNISGDRGLIRYCSDSLAARWLLGYDIDEALPVHSTLSRTRSLFGREVYEEVFRAVLGMCVDAGLVEGARQVADSALMKANASIDSMQRRVIMEDASAWCRQVSAENPDPPEASARDAARDDESGQLASVELPEEQRPRGRSNNTHCSDTDPDARLGRKPGKPTGMYYHGQVSVDASRGVIVGAMADYGDREDHQSLPALLDQVQANLAPHQLWVRELIADSKYNTLKTIEGCQKAGVTAYMPNPSGYKRHRDGFTYDPATDSYRCSQGVVLPYKRLDKCRDYYNKVYSSSAKDCAGCPIRSGCLTGKQTYKTLTHSSGKALYDQMDDRLRTPHGSRLLASRKGVVEPVLGNLLHQNGMRKVYARGLEAADKHVLMASISFNLKKWLKYAPVIPFGKAVALGKDRACAFWDKMCSVCTNILLARQKLAPVIAEY